MFILFLQLVFVLATIVQLYFWLVVFRKLAVYEEEPAGKNDRKEEKGVSIIICAHNEEKNIQRNLPRILNQNYRSYEVIVVSDNSTDGTEDILLKSYINNPILAPVILREKPDGMIGKKYALTKGIEAANYEILLLTDADCCPESENWLYEMQRKIEGPVEIGLGYAPYCKYPGFLNKLVRYETVYTAIQYLSYALAGAPYMGVGRNLIYKKALFKQTGGFTSHEHMASGDDDLFISAVAKTDNTTIILSPSTFVYSEPKKTWKNFYIQKSRHLTTGKHYTTKQKLNLGLLSASHLLHYLGGLMLIVKFSTIFVIILYVVRISSVLWVSRPLFSTLREKNLWKWIPILDAFFILYYLLFAPALLNGNTDKWK